MNKSVTPSLCWGRGLRVSAFTSLHRRRRRQRRPPPLLPPLGSQHPHLPLLPLGVDRLLPLPPLGPGGLHSSLLLGPRHPFPPLPLLRADRLPPPLTPRQECPLDLRSLSPPHLYSLPSRCIHLLRDMVRLSPSPVRPLGVAVGVSNRSPPHQYRWPLPRPPLHPMRPPSPWVPPPLPVVPPRRPRCRSAPRTPTLALPHLAVARQHAEVGVPLKVAECSLRQRTLRRG